MDKGKSTQRRASIRRFGSWLAIATVLLVGVAVAVKLVYKEELGPIQRPNAAAFDAAIVQRGANLASIGDCAVCHTVEGRPTFSGGRPLATPFGTIFATNITPDVATGIGAWSAAAFVRAMKDGVSRDGRHLYPALPYEHYTHTSDEDLSALYAFLMTRTPTEAVAPANKLIFPLSFRPLLAGWKVLFLHESPYVPDSTRTAQWNRGAYLVESLGHCGGCHTPRNVIGGERSSRDLEGGIAEGWSAPALDASNPNASSWDADGVYSYLRHGIDSRHSGAEGPMGPVAHGLARAEDTDVKAIAVYINYRMHGDSKTAPSLSRLDNFEFATKTEPGGAVIFSGACAGCHGPGAPMALQGRPALSMVTAVSDSKVRNALMAILQGLHSPTAELRPYMPPFGEVLSDEQIASVAAYVRARYTDQPPWLDLAKAVASARKESVEP